MRSFITSLYIILFLHQTTTDAGPAVPTLSCILSYSYIKPQPRPQCGCPACGCILSYSYIKPQLWTLKKIIDEVVYYPIPTSNHNCRGNAILRDRVVYYPIPTSNHNYYANREKGDEVVYYPIPTSNHNFSKRINKPELLYIILFLHQTTTILPESPSCTCCILSYSYIKPQPRR